MSEETMPKKRGRPKGRKDSVSRTKLPENKKQYNADSINFLRKVIPYERYKARKENIPELRRRFDEYLDECIQSGVRPANLQAYAALGISKVTAYNWEHGKDEQLKEFILYVKSFCSAYREKMMVDGEINNITGIFWQKNYDGLRDQQEHIITAQNPLGISQDENELAKKYLENSDIVNLPMDSTQTIEIIETEIVKDALD